MHPESLKEAVAEHEELTKQNYKATDRRLAEAALEVSEMTLNLLVGLARKLTGCNPAFAYRAVDMNKDLWFHLSGLRETCKWLKPELPVRGVSIGRKIVEYDPAVEGDKERAEVVAKGCNGIVMENGHADWHFRQELRTCCGRYSELTVPTSMILKLLNEIDDKYAQEQI